MVSGPLAYFLCVRQTRASEPFLLRVVRESINSVLAASLCTSAAPVFVAAVQSLKRRAGCIYVLLCLLAGQ